MHHAAILAVVFMATSLLLVPGASAGLILDIDLRGVYEDNITGSAADVGKKGDYYAVLSTSIGGYSQVGDGAYLFLRADAAGYLYRKYTDLNAAIIGVSAGVYKEFGDTLSAKAELRAKNKSYRESGRSGGAYSSALEIKQQILPGLWIREGYEFEKNIAGADIFSYTGHMLGIWSGYSISSKTLLTLGYSYLIRTYEEPSGFRNLFHTASSGIFKEVARKTYLSAAYNRQYINSSARGTSHTNNIYILAVTCSY